MAKNTTLNVEKYQDVLKLYRGNEIVNECPSYITFKGERAIDSGGVQRDMFSSFWEAAYNIILLLLEGSNLLTPMIHPQTDLAIFPIIGCILSYLYYVLLVIWIASYRYITCLNCFAHSYMHAS